MLNFEQILIKAAQYLDFDLNHLKLKHTNQKTRFVKRGSKEKQYNTNLSLLLQELGATANNKVIKNILKEFFSHYEFFQDKFNNSYKSKYDKSYDWLLLRYFVVPFFAVRVSENFSLYTHRADLGLPGGSFWYLPRHSKIYNNDKDVIIYPVNDVVNWWIDLSGMSNDDFYHQFIDIDDSTKSIKSGQHTLKKWHDTKVLPSREKIEEYASYELTYKGVFSLDKKKSLDDQFRSAIDFIERKKLTPEKLKNEIPNPDNIIDRLQDDLTDENKNKFISLVVKRWKKPSARRVQQILTVARASQALYIDLCNNFDVNPECTDIVENKILQLSYLFSTLHNVQMISDNPAETDYRNMDDKNPLCAEDFRVIFSDYLNRTKLLRREAKHVLNQTSVEIFRYQDTHNFSVPEIVLLLSQDADDKSTSVDVMKNELDLRDIMNNEIKEADRIIARITRTQDIKEAKKHVENITNCNVLNALGNYFQGDNHLTTSPRVQWLPLAVYIYTLYAKKADILEHKKIALFKLTRMLTNPFYPRQGSEENIITILQLLETQIDLEDTKEVLRFYTIFIYLVICQQDLNEVAEVLTEYLDFVNDLKPEEYDFMPLLIGIEILPKEKNSELLKELKKKTSILPATYPNLYKTEKIYYF